MTDHHSVNNNEHIDFVSIDGEVELTPPEIYAANLIEWAVDRHSSDLFVSDLENSIQVSVRRLGKIEPVRRLAKSYGRRLQGHLRVLAGADAGETIRPSEGRGVLSTEGGRTIDVRLSSMPTLHGQDVALRLFDPINGARAIEQLGLEPRELAALRDLISRPSGLILVAGPVASGKSSTLYAMVDALNDGTRKVHTLEDPIEHAIDGVMQSQVNLRAGLDFADLLSSVLRHSPDVIMIGEIRDKRTAATAVRAGASGQLVLATIHAKTAAEAVDAMLQYDSQPKFLAGALIGVINQRLMRRLCCKCAEPIPLNGYGVPPRVRDIMSSADPKLFRAVGCPECFNDGFDSLVCVPEILLVNRDVTTRIAEGSSAAELEKFACQEGLRNLAEVLAARVLSGATSAVEASRNISDPMIAELVAASR